MKKVNEFRASLLIKRNLKIVNYRNVTKISSFWRNIHDGRQYYDTSTTLIHSLERRLRDVESQSTSCVYQRNYRGHAIKSISLQYPVPSITNFFPNTTEPLFPFPLFRESLPFASASRSYHVTINRIVSFAAIPCAYLDYSTRRHVKYLRPIEILKISGGHLRLSRDGENQKKKEKKKKFHLLCIVD